MQLFHGVRRYSTHSYQIGDYFNFNIYIHTYTQNTHANNKFHRNLPKTASKCKAWSLWRARRSSESSAV